MPVALRFLLSLDQCSERGQTIKKDACKSFGNHTPCLLEIVPHLSDCMQSPFSKRSSKLTQEIEIWLYNINEMMSSWICIICPAKVQHWTMLFN